MKIKIQVTQLIIKQYVCMSLNTTCYYYKLYYRLYKNIWTFRKGDVLVQTEGTETGGLWYRVSFCYSRDVTFYFWHMCSCSVGNNPTCWENNSSKSTEWDYFGYRTVTLILRFCATVVEYKHENRCVTMDIRKVNVHVWPKIYELYYLFFFFKGL